MAAADGQMFAILEVAHSIQARLEGAFEEVGISGAKFEALDALAKAGDPLPLSELANRLACVRSNVTQLVDRLEADGMVRRVSDPTDRRSVRAELTELGVERQAAGEEVKSRLHAELEDRLEPDERALLQRVLRTLG